MRQVAQNYHSGELAVVEVPPPACRPGGVLVRTSYSLISTGTEVMKVREAKLSLAGKARARPEQLRQVLDTVTQQGPVATYKKVMTRLDSYTPLGYSLCGVVVEVGAGTPGFHEGQIVACAGNEFALHADLNWVPANLAVPVPAGVSPIEAAFATVGAIAMHGVRRCNAQLGEVACVIGLGLVGQLAVQLLVASGVVVVGLDPVAERCRKAEEAGAICCDAPSPEGLASVEAATREVSGGLGADHILLVAGGSSSSPVQAAARLARDRARVVDIGKTKLDLPWNAFYEKELDVAFSRSYGPGRYDARYELDGIDYPAGYVRWTERRNLECFVDLLGRGSLSAGHLVSGIFPITEATSVYERLSSGDLKGIGYLFEYGNPADADSSADLVAREAVPISPSVEGRAPASVDPVRVSSATPPAAGRRRLRVGFVGAGSYASSVLLPLLAGNEDIELKHVATTRSLSALSAQRRFGFESVGTEVDAVLEDEAIDAVFVVTRHASHAELVCRALEAHKSVFVEKPLALSNSELERILSVVKATGNDRLMVGFNRRFAPMLTEMRTAFGRHSVPCIANYSVNAGRLGAGSWYGDERAEGSRFVGEGGHFVDTLSWWLGAAPVEVYSTSTTDTADLVVHLGFDDGSVGTVSYVTNGNPRYPKEIFEVSGGGRTARLDNFRRSAVYTGRRRHVRRNLGSIDKGQRSALEAFARAVRTGEPMPIPLDSLVATTRATLAAEKRQSSPPPPPR